MELNKKDKRNRFLWMFKCDCGKEIELSASDVKQGRKYDCGCGKELRKKERLSKLADRNTLPNNAGPINKLFGAYRRGALKRGYRFSLSKEEFIKLIKNKCFYCGAEPSYYFTSSYSVQTSRSVLCYNGIDRKDNSKDYTYDNCLTACGICNRMKMDMGFHEFIHKIIEIHNNLKASSCS